MALEPRPRPLPQSLLVDRMQDLLLKTQDVKEMLDELAELSAITWADPAVAFCSITLIRRKKPVTVASSGERALRLDETQYGAGDGPCLSAIRNQVVVHVPDSAREPRWPAYSAAAVDAGVGSASLCHCFLRGKRKPA
jgi:hypothetical protein